MGYFTILHILALLFFTILFIFLVVLIYKEKRPKVFWAMILVSFFVTIVLMFSSMLALDNYTKKAKVENLTQKRVLLTESIVFSGQIRNIGAFTIDRCFLEVKMVNDPLKSTGLTGTQIFRPRSGLELDRNKKPSTIVHNFLIAKTLKPNELRNFSVSMPYPPHFSSPSVSQKLKCR
ncbi:MAG: DUF2393 domain-containing protein [Sulfurospirillaceae bacterium]|jgi:hypothetical protein|nr:DUF2393 domain-containing protein [Sulfurospirillaceae bacterium]MCK9545216.1 DUF2393 domain-containing protein [Sulfurospirillaceae bacterium]